MVLGGTLNWESESQKSNFSTAFVCKYLLFTLQSESNMPAGHWGHSKKGFKLEKPSSCTMTLNEVNAKSSIPKYVEGKKEIVTRGGESVPWATSTSSCALCVLLCVTKSGTLGMVFPRLLCFQCSCCSLCPANEGHLTRFGKQKRSSRLSPLFWQYR